MELSGHRPKVGDLWKYDGSKYIDSSTIRKIVLITKVDLENSIVVGRLVWSSLKGEHPWREFYPSIFDKMTENEWAKLSPK